MSTALLDHPPIALRRRRFEETLFVVVGMIAAVMGGALTTQAMFRFAGLPLGVIGLVVFSLGILQLARPTTLVLEPTGLPYSILGIDRFWLWEDISGFRLVRIRSGRAIVFDVARDGRSRTFAVPGFFTMRPIPLVSLLHDARSRWAIGGAPLLDDPIPLLNG